MEYPPNYFDPANPKLASMQTAGGVTLEFFPPGHIALSRELATGHHPKLAASLNRFLPEEIELKIAEVAMYCGIVLDGTYTLEERDKLCSILTGRLQVLREV